MQKTYAELQDSFTNHNIFFTTNGTKRHKDTDIINYLPGVEIEQYSAFLSGNNVFKMGYFSYSWSSLPIDTCVGRYCSIASNVAIMPQNHPMEYFTTSSCTYDRNFIIFKKFDENHDFTRHIYQPQLNKRKHGLIIGHDVWIGLGARLKNGITVGTGAIVGTLALVTHDVPPYAVVGGIPARIIKYRFNDYQINRLLNSQWWKYDIDCLPGFDTINIDSWLDKFENNLSERERERERG